METASETEWEIFCDLRLSFVRKPWRTQRNSLRSFEFKFEKTVKTLKHENWEDKNLNVKKFEKSRSKFF